MPSKIFPKWIFFDSLCFQTRTLWETSLSLPTLFIISNNEKHSRQLSNTLLKFLE